MTDIKAKPETKGLFATSAIVNMEWSSHSFEEPIRVRKRLKNCPNTESDVLLQLNCLQHAILTQRERKVA